MRIKDLEAAAWNPRTITEEELGSLRTSLADFGDLGGVIFNKRTGNLVGGHQRVTVFREAGGETEITIEERFADPTENGTVAYGYFKHGEERFSFREVDWDEEKEKKANLAANRVGGSWDVPKLTSVLEGLAGKVDNVSELASTGFNKEFLTEFLEERKGLGRLLAAEILERYETKKNAVDGVVDVCDMPVEEVFETINLPEETNFDENLSANFTCPKCGYKFN